MSTTIANARSPWTRRPEIRFPLRFGLLAALAAAIWAALTPGWPMLNGAMAHVVAWAARLTGLYAVTGPGAGVSFGDGAEKAYGFEIIPPCTGVMPLLIFSAAVIAYPATRNQRIVGLAIGLPALFVANLARLVGLAWVGLYWPSQFEAAHHYWGQALLLALVGLGWFAWVWWIADGRPSTRTPLRRAGTDSGTDARRVRLRSLLAPAAGFCGALAVLGAVGLAAHGVATWGRLLDAPVARVGIVFDIQVNTRLSGRSILDSYGFFYSTMAAVVALFIASPGPPWRFRIRAALFAAVPGVYIIQVTMLLSLLGTATFQNVNNGVITPFVTALHLPLSFGIAAALWHWWLRRTAHAATSAPVHAETAKRARPRKRPKRAKRRAVRRARRKSR